MPLDVAKTVVAQMANDVGPGGALRLTWHGGNCGAADAPE